MVWEGSFYCSRYMRLNFMRYSGASRDTAGIDLNGRFRGIFPMEHVILQPDVYIYEPTL